VPTHFIIPGPKKLFWDWFTFPLGTRHEYNRDLTNCGKKKSKNNIQDVGLLAKCGCIMRTIIVYWLIINILVCLVFQKLANCTFIPNS
jgi:hypothetical protein